MNDLRDIIKKLSFKFAKYHYHKYIDSKNISKINDDDINDVVCQFFNEEKEKEFKHYIRFSLKNKFKEDYNSFAVENIITEIFPDKVILINRIGLEIKNYQKV